MIETGLAFLLGLLLGSFLNVCIDRWPRDASVVKPGSHCGACGRFLRWHDNVPLLSFVWLRGRCRDCRAFIGWTTPLVELLTGLLFAAAVLTWGPTAHAAKWAACFFLFLGMIVTDLQTRLLPDQFTLGGAALGVGAAALAPFEGGLFATLWPGLPPRLASVAQALLAAGLLSWTMWVVGWLYSRIRHKEGLGFGDVKMVAMMGAFLGLSQALAAVFLGCLAGALGGLAYIRLARKDPATYELPFGSFLGAAGIVVAFRGEGLLRWYTQL